MLCLWNTLLSIQEMRSAEMKQQQEALVSVASGSGAAFQPQTYEGDNNEVLEIVARALCTDQSSHYDPAVSNQLATVFCYSCFASMQFLREYYQVTLPKKLTEEQRAATLAWGRGGVVRRSDLLRVLEDASVSDTKKSCILVYAIIPLVSATYAPLSPFTPRCHNASMNLEKAIPGSFVQQYITEYLPSVQSRTASVHKDLLLALLQFNSLLIKHIPSQIAPYRNKFNAFAVELYVAPCDELVAWSLFFQCQYLVAYEYTGVQIVKLFINIIHLYSNRCRDVIYRASALLAKRTCVCVC